MTVSRLLARPLLASVFVFGGANALKNADKLAGAAHGVGDNIVPEVKKRAPQVPLPEDPVNQVRLTGAIHLLGGLALATGRAPRLSATVLAASLVPTTIGAHAFWEETEPEAKAGQRIHFLKNVSVLGGLLLASVDTEGKPGVAWRARRAGRDARREARHLAGSARREARIAKAQVS